MGERFPEYDEWLATEKAEKEEHWRRVRELEGDPKGHYMFALEKLTGKKAADVCQGKATCSSCRLAWLCPASPKPSRRSDGTILALAGAARSSRTAA